MSQALPIRGKFQQLWQKVTGEHKRTFSFHSNQSSPFSASDILILPVALDALASVIEARLVVHDEDNHIGLMIQAALRNSCARLLQGGSFLLRATAALPVVILAVPVVVSVHCVEHCTAEEDDVPVVIVVPGNQMHHLSQSEKASSVAGGHEPITHHPVLEKAANARQEPGMFDEVPAFRVS